MTGILDLGAEIATNNGGNLRGGEINFLGRLQHNFEATLKGNFGRGDARVLVFSIDDNVDADNIIATVMAVVTKQSLRELRPIIEAAETNNFFLMSVAVRSIGDPMDALQDEDGNGVVLKPVVGRLTLRTKPGDDMDLRRAKFLPAPTSAIATQSYNAAGKCVHVHLVCLEHTELPIDIDRHVRTSRTEKERRIMALFAKLDPDGRHKAEDDAFFARNVARSADGGHRALALRTLH